MSSSDLGRNMKRHREHHRLTQEDAASRADISPSNWRVMEAGGRESYRGASLVGVDRALQWDGGTAEQLLEGILPDVDLPPRADSADDDRSQMWRYIGRLEDRIWRLEELVEELGDALEQATSDISTIADQVDESMIIGDYVFPGFRPRRPQAGPNLWESYGLELVPPPAESQAAADTGTQSPKKGPKRKPEPPADQDDV